MDIKHLFILDKKDNLEVRIYPEKESFKEYEKGKTSCLSIPSSETFNLFSSLAKEIKGKFDFDNDIRYFICTNNTQNSAKVVEICYNYSKIK
jgi:hypothetical protein